MAGARPDLLGKTKSLAPHHCDVIIEKQEESASIDDINNMPGQLISDKDQRRRGNGRSIDLDTNAALAVEDPEKNNP